MKSSKKFASTENSDCIYTLEEFAMEFFNPMNQETGGGFFNFSKKEREIVWAKTQEPIRTSHLRSVPLEIVDLAVVMFTTVLKYCGDYPSKEWLKENKAIKEYDQILAIKSDQNRVMN
jgi:hypothetical protein